MFNLQLKRLPMNFNQLLMTYQLQQFMAPRRNLMIKKQPLQMVVIFLLQHQIDYKNLSMMKRLIYHK